MFFLNIFIYISVNLFILVPTYKIQIIINNETSTRSILFIQSAT